MVNNQSITYYQAWGVIHFVSNNKKRAYFGLKIRWLNSIYKIEQQVEL